MSQKRKFNVDKHLARIERNAQGAPEPEEILAEVERGDYSSFDPQYLEDLKTTKQTKKGFLPRAKEKIHNP